MDKSNLHEIKRNQIGTGILIENDGYISMEEGKNRQIKESVDNVDGWYCPYPFVVDAVFQKYGIKNANGRIYPESVLRKQVEVYQQKVQDKRALGECYRPTAKILTKTGWKQLSEVTIGEEVLTLNTETNNIEIKPILNIIRRNHDGNMIHIKGQSIDDIVTEEHGYPIYDRNNKFKGFWSACDIKNQNISDFNHCYIPKQGNWIGELDEFIIIPRIDSDVLSKKNMKTTLKEKYSQDLIIPIEIYAKFMGIYLSEGSYTRGKGYRVNIHQKKDDICDEIQIMLDTWGIDYSVNVHKNGCKTFVISDMRLHKYVSQFGYSYEKYVPYEMKKQPQYILKIFYDWFVMGDGRIRGDKRRKGGNLSTDVFSTSYQMILDLNEIQLKIGYSGVYHYDARDYNRNFQGREIKAENSLPLHFSYLSLTKGIYLDKRFLKVQDIPYCGEVMCVEVENHTWYVMDNDKCHWTKNCNHPAETVIDLGRISHNIIELHWEGRTLVGKMELNVTQGFVKQGICSSFGDTVANLLLNGYKIGVSSRGVGSVEQKMGNYIVGDDFELICWDVVADPSTPNAYISTNGTEELVPYLESKENTKSILNEKINKIKSILN